MLLQESPQVRTEGCSAHCYAFFSGMHVVSIKHLPRENRLLAALPEADYARLLPDLEPVAFRAGHILHCPNAPESYLYFITAGLVSRYGELKEGNAAEFQSVGCEGVIGMSCFLGGESTPFWAEALSAGFAYRIPRRVVAREFAQNGPFEAVLLRYYWFVIQEIGQIAACNRHHALDERLCRWILCSLDRLNSAQMEITQEAISHVLGVRREGVTQAMGRLKNEGLILNKRGHITVLDRPRLEASSCECYANIRCEQGGDGARNPLLDQAVVKHGLEFRG